MPVVGPDLPETGVAGRHQVDGVAGAQSYGGQDGAHRRFHTAHQGFGNREQQPDAGVDIVQKHPTEHGRPHIGQGSFPDVAPKHVERIKALARAGEYDNVSFHRVIDGFMAQTGDVANGDMEDNFNLRRAGTGGSKHPDLPAEFSKLPFDRGVVGMARSQNPNSGNSQFFIMFKEGHFLNGQYTVWGRVTEGMEHVDAITRGEPPTTPDRMISVRVAADA